MIPLYYQRDRDGLPRGWIKRMKRTIRTLGWRFNADRMVMDYTLEMLRAGGRRNVQQPAQEGLIRRRHRFLVSIVPTARVRRRLPSRH